MNLMKDWPVAQVEMEYRRGAILRHLSETPGRQLTFRLLRMGCTSQGVPSNMDQIENAVNWLEENGLVEASKLVTLPTAILTEDGAEVVKGVRKVSGLSDPSGEF